MVRCAECGKLGEGSMEGWRAMLGIDIDDENAPTEAYVFCPACADRSSARLEESREPFVDVYRRGARAGERGADRVG
jgi:hypothetical protein